MMDAVHIVLRWFDRVKTTGAESTGFPCGPHGNALLSGRFVRGPPGGMPVEHCGEKFHHMKPDVETSAGQGSTQWSYGCREEVCKGRFGRLKLLRISTKVEAFRFQHFSVLNLATYWYRIS